MKNNNNFLWDNVGSILIVLFNSIAIHLSQHELIVAKCQEQTYFFFIETKEICCYRHVKVNKYALIDFMIVAQTKVGQISISFFFGSFQHIDCLIIVACYQWNLCTQYYVNCDRHCFFLL